MHAVKLKLLLKSGEYETETREWSKIPEDQKTWTAWKTTFREVYLAKRRAEVAREGEDKPFGGDEADEAHNKLSWQAIKSSAVPAPL